MNKITKYTINGGAILFVITSLTIIVMAFVVAIDVSREQAKENALIRREIEAAKYWRIKAVEESERLIQLDKNKKNE